ncbi:hypothetical protein HUU05_21235 [candidate division KSB1 bacterium]|nr:hypothetical protein [candidate division KSB1 bacterium]
MSMHDDRFALAEQLWEEREFKKAMVVYQDLLQDESLPQIARALVCEYIGRLCIGIGKLSQAEKFLRQAVAMEPEDVDHYVQLANCLCLAEKNQEAWEMIQWLYQRHPEHPAAIHYYGKLLDERGEHERGLALMKEAVKLDPHNERFLADLAFAYMMAGNAGAAVICSEEAMALNPEDEVVQFIHEVAAEFEQQEAQRTTPAQGHSKREQPALKTPSKKASRA